MNLMKHALVHRRVPTMDPLPLLGSYDLLEPPMDPLEDPLKES